MFIELVIVVLGVFIGLQVQEWATARAEQQRADVLLQQLRGDLDSERINMNAYLDYQRVTAAYARTAIKGLEPLARSMRNPWWPAPQRARSTPPKAIARRTMK